MTDRAQTDSYYMCGRLWQTSLSFLFPSGKISQDLELGLHCLCVPFTNVSEGLPGATQGNLGTVLARPLTSS